MSRSSRLAKLPALALRPSHVFSALSFRRTPILCTAEVERCLGLLKDKTEVSDGRRAQGEGWGGFLHHRLLFPSIAAPRLADSRQEKVLIVFFFPGRVEGKDEEIKRSCTFVLGARSYGQKWRETSGCWCIKRKAQRDQVGYRSPLEFFSLLSKAEIVFS